jgi:hypothetical protein
MTLPSVSVIVDPVDAVCGRRSPSPPNVYFEEADWQRRDALQIRGAHREAVYLRGAAQVSRSHLARLQPYCIAHADSEALRQSLMKRVWNRSFVSSPGLSSGDSHTARVLAGGLRTIYADELRSEPKSR